MIWESHIGVLGLKIYIKIWSFSMNISKSSNKKENNIKGHKIYSTSSRETH